MASLDLPDSVLRDADWVIASLHYGQKQPGDVITRRLLNAVEKPLRFCYWTSHGKTYWSAQIL